MANRSPPHPRHVALTQLTHYPHISLSSSHGHPFSLSIPTSHGTTSHHLHSQQLTTSGSVKECVAIGKIDRGTECRCGSNIGVLLLNKSASIGWRTRFFPIMCHMTTCSLLNYVFVFCFHSVDDNNLMLRRREKVGGSRSCHRKGK